MKYTTVLLALVATAIAAPCLNGLDDANNLGTHGDNHKDSHRDNHKDSHKGSHKGSRKGSHGDIHVDKHVRVCDTDQTQVCCNGLLGCALPILGKNCDGKSYCCPNTVQIGLININALNCVSLL